MSSMMRGVVFATAIAVSGTVVLLALRLQKSLQFPLHLHHHHHSSSPPIPRSCISSPSDEKKKKMKKKKRVHFAEEVVESRRDGDGEVRRNCEDSISKSETKVRRSCSDGGIERRGMPANRVALYNGILRDRVAQRLAYSY